jgi:HprK-related kinase A
MHRGWRLLSDEFGLVRPGDPELRFHPLPRPVPLKNASIDVIRRFVPEAVIGPTFPKTRKGDVAHVMAPIESQQRYREPAPAGWILFPRYQQGSDTQVETLGGNWTFLKLSSNSFNYALQGAAGFETVRGLVDRCPAWALQYSDLDDALGTVDRLTRPQ